MTYNQTKVNGVAMPLLMGCTEPTKLETLEEDVVPIYDPIAQTSIMNAMGVHYTMSQKAARTDGPGFKGRSDRKTVKDDHKVLPRG